MDEFENDEEIDIDLDDLLKEPDLNQIEIIEPSKETLRKIKEEKKIKMEITKLNLDKPKFVSEDLIKKWKKKEEKTKFYNLFVICENCGHTGIELIPKGETIEHYIKRVKKTMCPKCGCLTGFSYDLPQGLNLLLAHLIMEDIK